MRNAEKRGDLFGGALTDEVLDSSRSILQRNRGGAHTKGLQQYFTPEPAARFIAGVIGHAEAVLDPTAGAGSLLDPFAESARYGVEIDGDLVRAASATASAAAGQSEDAPSPVSLLHRDATVPGVGEVVADVDAARVFYCAAEGDVQRVVPMLRAAGLRWPAVVANPPFRETWRDAARPKVRNSTPLAYLWSLDLLRSYGQGAILLGSSALEREVMTLPEASAIYAVVDVDGPLFDGVSLPVSIAFFVNPSQRPGQTPRPPVRLSAKKDGLSALVYDVRAARRTAASLILSDADASLPGDFRAVAREARRRARATLRGKDELRSGHDVTLRGNKIVALPKPYAKLVLSNKKRLTAVEHLHNQNAAYFGQNPKSYRELVELAAEGVLSLSPELKARAERAVADAARLATPLFPVKPQMRVGWLTDLEKILCTKDDPERGFVAGREYDLKTASEIDETVEERIVEKKDKTPEKRKFTLRRRLLRITIGTHDNSGNRAHTFDEGKESSAYLLEHFDLPDPGCVATRHPELVEKNRRILTEIQQEYGLLGTDRELRPFQLDHDSRLLVKGRGVLGHKQGLGKCVGSMDQVLINGTLITAEDAWARFASDERHRDDEGEWASPTQPLATTALAADGRMVDAPISRLYRQKVSEWGRRVTLDDGSSLTITDRHKLHAADDWTVDINPGDRVAVPRRLVWEGRPEDSDLAELLAWQIAEGHEDARIGRVTITQKDGARLERLRELALTVGERYGLPMHSLPIATPLGRSPFLGIYSRPYRSWLERELGYEWGRKSADKHIPDRILAADDATVRAFLRAFIAAEGSVNPAMRVVEVSSASRRIMEGISLMLRRFGVWLRVSEKRKQATNGARIVRTYYNGLVGGESLRRLHDLVGIDDTRKAARLAEVASKPQNTNVGGVPVADILQEARETTRLPWLHLTTSRAYAFNSGGASPEAARKIADMLAAAAGEGAGGRWRGPKGKPAYPSTLAAYEALDREALLALSDRLRRRADREVHYARVVSVERVRLDGYVYDFSVPEHHSYVAGGMLAHNTLQQMMLEKAQVRLGAAPQTIKVVPQDLIPQWQAENLKFFGERFEVIGGPLDARRVSREILANPEEPRSFITHFEALSLVGRKREVLPEEPLDRRLALGARLAAYKKHKRHRAEAEANAGTADGPGQTPDTRPVLQDSRFERTPYDDRLPDLPTTTRDACPKCRADTDAGWNGEICTAPKYCVTHGRGGACEHEGRGEGCVVKGCGYVHTRVRVKPAASHLTKCFRGGVKSVDELTEISGDSLKSEALRAMDRGTRRQGGAHNYGATGTPQKNYAGDTFWAFYFCFGGGSVAFPYGYDGKERYAAEFNVEEILHGRKEDGEEHLKVRKKTLPILTNVSQFWRMTQPLISRCRKEQTGEPLVPLTYNPIEVPMGVRQQQMHAFWMENFPAYFEWKYPDHPLVKDDLVEKWAAGLGQRWRLEGAATLPGWDGPTQEWPYATAELGTPSNWTPAVLKLLETVMERVARGEKVLVGSCLKEFGPFVAQALTEKGVRANHITDVRGAAAGRATVTKSPKKRARAVREFAKGDAQVLCAGVQAIKLGHSLEAASAVVLLGLPDSWVILDQFIERVHRLTSEKPVNIYVILPRQSIAQTKWGVLQKKGDSSDLAFDGEFMPREERPVNWNEEIRRMRRRGIGLRATGDLVPEEEVLAAWKSLAPLYFMPARTVAPQPPRLQAPPLQGSLALSMDALLQADPFLQDALF